MGERKLITFYTNTFIYALNNLGEVDTYVTPELTKNGRLNFKVEVQDKPSKLFYVTYNIQSGYFDVHVSKVCGLNEEKAAEAIKSLEFLTDNIEMLNGELDTIRELIDTHGG